MKKLILLIALALPLCGMAQIEPFTFKSVYMTSGICITSMDREDTKPRTITYDGDYITITYDESGKQWAKLKVVETAIKQSYDKYVQWFRCEDETGKKKIVIKEPNSVKYYGFNELGITSLVVYFSQY